MKNPIVIKMYILLMFTCISHVILDIQLHVIDIIVPTVTTVYMLLLFLPKPKSKIVEGKISSVGTVTVGNSYNCILVPLKDAENCTYIANDIVKGKVIKNDLGQYEFHVTENHRVKNKKVIHFLEL